jgi:hypothetical protein
MKYRLREPNFILLIGKIIVLNLEHISSEGGTLFPQPGTLLCLIKKV